MQVVFKTNLGIDDAKSFGLDPKKCQKGMTLDVSNEVGAKLTAERGTQGNHGSLAVTPEEAKKDELIQSALGVSKEDFEKGESTLTPVVKAVAKPAEITAPAKHDKHDK